MSMCFMYFYILSFCMSIDCSVWLPRAPGDGARSAGNGARYPEPGTWRLSKGGGGKKGLEVYLFFGTATI